MSSSNEKKNLLVNLKQGKNNYDTVSTVIRQKEQQQQHSFDKPRPPRPKFTGNLNLAKTTKQSQTQSQLQSQSNEMKKSETNDFNEDISMNIYDPLSEIANIYSVSNPNVDVILNESNEDGNTLSLYQIIT
jgi:hypothetical protein